MKAIQYILVCLMTFKLMKKSKIFAKKTKTSNGIMDILLDAFVPRTTHLPMLAKLNDEMTSSCNNSFAILHINNTSVCTSNITVYEILFFKSNFITKNYYNVICFVKSLRT